MNTALDALVQSTEYSLAVGGTDSWYMLTQFADIVNYSPTHVIIEYAVNDAVYGGTHATDRANGWWPCCEALIRQLRTQLPNTRLIFVNLAKQEEFNDAAHIASRDAWLAVCTKYEIEDYRIDEWIQAIYGDPTPTEEQINVYHDGVHFTEAGHNAIFDMLEPHLPVWYPSANGDWMGNLADYGDPIYADVEDFMGTPISRNGTDNDGETGAGWTTDGTSRQSSTAGDTISWTGTFTAFGLDGTIGAEFQMTYAIDGGAEVSFNFASGGIKPLRSIARGVHTVVFKVVAGNCKIDKFLAI